MGISQDGIPDPLTRELSGIPGVTQIHQDGGMHVFRLTLPLPLPGFRDFVTPWLISDEGRSIVVDPGPKATVEDLIAKLESFGVSRVDLVLLTHAHIDHCGGTADLLSAFPEAKVAAHPKAVPHLLDPSRLWEGSLQTLGEKAIAYGPIGPVDPGAISKDPRQIPNLTIIETPGHASHHQSYSYRGKTTSVLLAGEAAGIYLGGGYLRPATPPRFFFQVAYESLTRLSALSPSLICYGHYGYTRDSRWPNRAKDQLQLWRTIASETLSDSGHSAVSPPKSLIPVVLRKLFKEDPFLAEFASLDPDIAQREKYFIENSIKGFLTSDP